MKDIVISARTLRREVLVWVACIVAVTLLNAYAISLHHTQWSELYSLWYVVLPLSVVLYVVLWPVRWSVRLVVRLVHRSRKDKNG